MKLTLCAVVVVGAILWAISAHAQKDLHNGPVAIRPMVTAPSLMGKTPPRPKIVRCAEERAQLKQILQAATRTTPGAHRPKSVPAGVKPIRRSRRPRLSLPVSQQTVTKRGSRPANMYWVNEFRGRRAIADAVRAKGRQDQP